MSESSGPLPLRVTTVADDADRAALERIARDELGALDELYERYKTMAYSIAYRITDDGTLAEDVVQEAFLGVWRNATRYVEGRGSVSEPGVGSGAVRVGSRGGDSRPRARAVGDRRSMAAERIARTLLGAVEVCAGRDVPDTSCRRASEGLSNSRRAAAGPRSTSASTSPSARGGGT